MKTSPFSKADLHRSVISVPPLCRNSSLRPDAVENANLIRHIEAGGVSTLLYGGNANFYNIALSEYEEVLGQLEASAAADTWVIPSIGPYFGTAMDQAAILKRHKFPTAMLLPTLAASHPEGVRNAVPRIAEKAGIPLVLYVKDQGYVTPAVVRALVDTGVISWIKYAVVRDNTAEDPLLAAIVDEVGTDLLVSGIGEQPVPAHWNHFGIRSYTSGCVCVAPALSQRMLLAMRAGDVAAAEKIRLLFRPLETLRNANGPIAVLHLAVALAGIAKTGPMLPLLTDVAEGIHNDIQAAALKLLEDL
jgi:dihydrodipicolinate synthase/N-acetylneuraminate lyase